MMNAFRKKRFVLPVLAYKCAVMSSILKCAVNYRQQVTFAMLYTEGDKKQTFTDSTDSLGHPCMILLRAYCKWISFLISQF